MKYIKTIICSIFFLSVILLNIPVVLASQPKNLIADKSTNARTGSSTQRNICFVNGWYVSIFVDNASQVGLYYRTSSDSVVWGNEGTIDTSTYGLYDSGFDIDDDGVEYIGVGWCDRISTGGAGTYHRHYMFIRGLVNDNGTITLDAQSEVFGSGIYNSYDCGKIGVCFNPSTKHWFYVSGMDEGNPGAAYYYFNVYHTTNNATSWTRDYHSSGWGSSMSIRYTCPVVLATLTDDVWIYLVDYTSTDIHYLKWDGASISIATQITPTNYFGANTIKEACFSGTMVDELTVLVYTRAVSSEDYAFAKRHYANNNTWPVGETIIGTDATNHITYPSVSGRTNGDFIGAWVEIGDIYTRRLFRNNMSWENEETTWGTDFTTPVYIHGAKIETSHLFTWQEDSYTDIYFGSKGTSITVTFYQNGNGHFYVDGTEKSNGTIAYYFGNAGIELQALPHINYTLSYFLENETELLDNPYSYIITDTVDLWAIFTSAGGSPPVLSGNATESTVLDGYSFYNNSTTTIRIGTYEETQDSFPIGIGIGIVVGIIVGTVIGRRD